MTRIGFEPTNYGLWGRQFTVKLPCLSEEDQIRTDVHDQWLDLQSSAFNHSATSSLNLSIYMVQLGTKLPTIDNSGAQLIECIHVLKRHPKDRGKTGSVMVVAIKKKGNSTKIKQGQVLKGMLINTKFNILRKSGIKVKFNQNSAILLNEQLAPIATRITGPLTRELRKKKNNENVING